MTSSTPPKKELKGGRYVLLRTLGEGSQGETYEAMDNGRGPRDPKRAASLADDWTRYVRRASTHEELPRDSGQLGDLREPVSRDSRELGDLREPVSRDSRDLVAIKCFRVGKAKAWKDVELAEREARTLAALDHPRLPKYIEHFEEDGALCLVMEKIEGESIASLRAKRRTWTVAEVTKMLEDIGDALRYMHGRSPFIVHRDIKPGNVIRRPDGSFALVDFGAVRDRLSPAGGSTVVGTFGYMAPEQFQGRASPKSDVYGVAATALAMLTGEEPENLPHEGLGIDVQRALPKGTPTPLVRALAAMLVPDPDRRIDSVDDALAFLRVKTDTPKKSSPPPQLTNLSKSQKRALRQQRKREAREEKRRKRAAALGRRAPFVPRLVAQIALLGALIVVWVTVGLVTPFVLAILSLIFGKALRRAANACVEAAQRSQAAIGRASSWLAGHRAEDSDAAQARVRVATELDQVRAVTEGEAQAIAMARDEARGVDADAWMEERLARETERLALEEKRQRLVRQPEGAKGQRGQGAKGPRGRE